LSCQGVDVSVRNVVDDGKNKSEHDSPSWEAGWVDLRRGRKEIVSERRRRRTRASRAAHLNGTDPEDEENQESKSVPPGEIEEKRVSRLIKESFEEARELKLTTLGLRDTTSSTERERRLPRLDSP